ncbi:MAG: CRISPR-associated endonuclease Cas1 [Anaerolineae bacterium]
MPILHHLIVDQYGAFLGKHSGRLRVSKDGEKLAEAPLLHLEQVLVTGEGVALSADAIAACCTAGIPIYFLDPGGRPYAALYSAGLTGTVLTRREQLLAYRDRRGVELAVAFARGKITNQAGFLRYAARYREEAAPEVGRLLKEEAERVLDGLEELRRLRGETVEEVRGQILAIEGRAAQRYWDALKAVVPESYGWPGRQTRGAQDPVNAALNYGYGILYGQVERALVLAGLDPYGGFIHADRPGKPSLVFDLIEEFRIVVVDRTVVGMVTKGVKLEMEDGRLTEAARRTVAEKVLERLDAAERYEKRRQPLRVILQSQARHIATFVRGDRAAYEPFIARW